MRRTRRQCNRQQSRASRKMRRSSRLTPEAPVMLARRTTTRALPRIFRLIWIPPTPPRKNLLESIQPKKKNTCQIFQPQKIPESKISNPQNWIPSIRARHLKSEVLPLPPPPPPARLQDLWASETEKPSLMPSQYQELLSRRKPGDFLCFAAQDSFAY